MDVGIQPLGGDMSTTVRNKRTASRTTNDRRPAAKPDAKPKVKTAAMPQSAAAPSPFTPIAEYGFLSDCHTGALIAPDGTIDCLCVPRFDSPSVFGALLDRGAGAFPLGPFGINVPSGRIYEPGTNTLVTSWKTPSGWATVREALTMGPRRDKDTVTPHTRPPADEDAEHSWCALSPAWRAPSRSSSCASPASTTAGAGYPAKGRCPAIAAPKSRLFTASIRDNARLTRPEASDREIERALRRARIWDPVSGFQMCSTPPPERRAASLPAASSSGSSSPARCSQPRLCWCCTSPPRILDPDTASELIADVISTARDPSVLLITHRTEGGPRGFRWHPRER